MPSSFPIRILSNCLKTPSSFGVCGYLALTLLIAVAGVVRGQHTADDARFLSGLCERRLFELAESHCRKRLQAPLAPRAEAELTAEWVRILALHASHAPPAQRQALWTAAHQKAREYFTLRANSPFAPLIRLQDALAWLAKGEFGRQQFETGAITPDNLDSVRQALGAASKGCEQLDRDLRLEIPQRRRTPPPAGEPTADELFTLQMHAAHQAARAHRNSALLYPRGSADRLALLQQSQEQLQTPLAQVAVDDPLAAKVRLDLAICERLLGKHASADELLAALDQPPLAADIRLAARAERIRSACERKDLAALDPLLGLGRILAGQTSAELDFAWFESHLARAQATAGNPSAENWRKSAADAARFLLETHGGYWGRRADELLLASAPAGSAPDALLLLRTADNLYAKGEAAQALAAYDRAAASAEKDDRATAFSARYKAALVVQKQGDPASAASRFRLAATAARELPASAETHLLAVWLAAEALKKAGDSRLYRELLREHLEFWPQGKSADQARLWQGRLGEADRDWAAALAAYRNVSPSAEGFPSAVAGAARAWRERLEALRESGDVTAEARSAGQWLREIVYAGSEPSAAQPPNLQSPAAREALLGWAELTARFDPASAATVEPLLAAAQQQSPNAPPEWAARTTSLRLLLLAAQPGREQEASALLAKPAGTPTSLLLAELDGIRRLREKARPEIAPALVRLELAAIENLSRQKNALSEADQNALARLHAAALAANGQRREARLLYEKLVQQHPDSGPLREEFAGLLLLESDRPSVEQGLAEWRRIAARSQPQTPRWFSAKYHIALAMYRLGDSAGAAQLLSFILETTAGAKNPQEASYRLLLASCQGIRK